MRLRTFVLGTLLLAASTVANAALITFDSLGGPNGTPFVGTTEDGFDVAPSLGSSWQHAFNVGNPIPSIFNLSASGEGIVVTESLGGLFTFDSIDFGTGATSRGSYRYTLTGAIGLATQFVQVGTFTGVFADGFTTIASAFPGTAIDSLDLTISNFQISSVNVDNIGVTSVPEPGTIGLLGVGLVLAGLRLRRRGGGVV